MNYKNQSEVWKKQRAKLLKERESKSVPELARQYGVSESWINTRLDKARKDHENKNS